MTKIAPDLYKQKGSTKRVEIRKRDYFDKKTVTHILRTAGFSIEEVRQFLSECDHTRH
jgi:DNA-binding transcriptional MerR regulator